MIEVLAYEKTIAEVPNELVCKLAHEIMSNKVSEIHRVLNNPGKMDVPSVDEDLIGR